MTSRFSPGFRAIVAAAVLALVPLSLNAMAAEEVSTASSEVGEVRTEAVNTAINEAKTAVAETTEAAAKVSTTALKATDQLIIEIVNGIKAGKDFAVEQVPDVVKQFLLYQAIKGGIYTLFFFMLLGLSIYGLVRMWKWMGKERKGYYDNNWEAYGPAICFPIVAVSLTGWLSLACLFDFLKVIIAPKVYLLEYAASLIK